MTRVCEICGKSKMAGSTISSSHSHKSRVTNKTYNANLQTATILVDGKEKRVTACTKCIKTAKKAK